MLIFVLILAVAIEPLIGGLILFHGRSNDTESDFPIEPLIGGLILIHRGGTTKVNKENLLNPL